MLQKEHRGFLRLQHNTHCKEAGGRLFSDESVDCFFNSPLSTELALGRPDLMRIVERPVRFPWIYYTTIRAKRKAADPKARRFNAFREKSHPIEIMISHIQHFINNFQPIAD